MKHFGKYLAIGLSAAMAVALAACYFVWSLHSIHRLVWFGIAFFFCALVLKYLCTPIYVEYKGENGKIRKRKISTWEQVGNVVRNAVGIAIIGALVWTIGYGVACLFEWHPVLWEMYLLYGVGVVAAVCLVIWLIWWIWILSDDFIHNRHHTREQVKTVLLWTVVVICSLAVAGAILYFLFPLAIKL